MDGTNVALCTHRSWMTSAAQRIERRPDMHVEISTDNTINGSEALIADLTAAIQHELGHFDAHVTRVEVHLQDTNAGKSGPDDIECTLEVRLKGQQPVITKDASDTLDKATKGASTKMKALLTTTLGKLSERR